MRAERSTGAAARDPGTSRLQAHRLVTRTSLEGAAVAETVAMVVVDHVAASGNAVCDSVIGRKESHESGR